MRWFFRLLVLAATAATATALADPMPVERRIEQPNGASLIVRTVDFRADSIVLSVAIANAGDRAISLNRGRSLVLDDDAQGVHYLNPPPDNPELTVPPRSQLNGELVFIGPPAPSVRRLSLANDAFDATPPTDGQREAGAAYQADRPDGTALRVRRIRASRPACIVSMLATNGSDRTLVLNPDRGLVLVDAHGAAAPVKPPADNRELVVPAGDRLDAELVFDCRSIDPSGPLTLASTRGAAGAKADPGGAAEAFTLQAAVEDSPAAPLPERSRAVVEPIAWSRLSEPAAAGAGPPARATPAPPAPAAAARQPAAPSAAAVPGDLAGMLHARKTERGLRLSLPADALFGAAANRLDRAADAVLGHLAKLIAATGMREVIVTVHAGETGADPDDKSLPSRRARAITAWLEKHATEPRPRFVAKSEAAPKTDPDSLPESERRPWVDVILRRDYLVPNSRSPASPSPGKI